MLVRRVLNGAVVIEPPCVALKALYLSFFLSLCYVGEKPFDTIVDLVQDGLITLYMEANNVEDYLQTARRRTRHLTSSSSSSYCSLPFFRPHPQASAMSEPLIEEVEESTPSPPHHSSPPGVPLEPSLSREQRERSSSASSAPSDHEHTHAVGRRPRTYDEIEDVTLGNGTATVAQTVSNVYRPVM